VSNCEVFQDPRYQGELPEDSTIFDRLIGYTVFDIERGQIGTITGFIAQEFNPVFMIDHQGSEIMIPANDHLIDHIDQSAKSVYFRLPEGIIDL
jgi:16S rRNA processing protein RimM